MNTPLTLQERQRAFSGLPEADQLRQIEGHRWERAFAFDRATVDEKARTVWMSIASETPYVRWWGEETLAIEKKAIRAGRLDNGAPILMGHESSDQVGVVERWEIAGKKLRVLARFGTSARAQEVWADVLGGIRRNTSIGYLVHKAVLTEKGEEINKYRVTDWEPLEGSLVGVPADPSVGPGRALEVPQTGSRQMAEDSKVTDSSTALAEQHRAGDEAARADERKLIARRNGEIQALGEQWPQYGGLELAKKAIADPAMTVEAFRATMLKVLGEKHRPMETGRLEADYQQQGQGASRGSYGVEPREMMAAANLKVFRGVGEIMGRKDHEVAYRAGRWLMGVVHGDADSLRWCRDAGVLLQQGNREQLGFGSDQRAMTEGIFTSAGWLVPSELEAAIIANREDYGAARRVCNVIPMSSATLSMPRVTSDTSAYFVGEGSSGTESSSSGDQVQLSLKDLMAWTNIGKSTAMDTAISLAEFTAREQARAFAVKEDACWLVGDGTSTYGGMQGIITMLEAAAYAGGRSTTASGHDTFPEIDVSDATNVIGLLPVYARTGARWICSGVFDAMVFGRLKLGAGGNTIQTVQGRIVEGDYAGFPITLAQGMPAGGGTDYTAKVMALLGNFQLGSAFGSGTGMMLTVDPYTLAHQNLTRLITTERLDINNHGVNKSTTVAGPIICMYGNS